MNYVHQAAVIDSQRTFLALLGQALDVILEICAKIFGNLAY
jgi:hypothetical protein